MGLTTENLNKIKQLAEEVCKREGCILYDIEMVGGANSRALRIYIDRATLASKDTPPGASIDDCANISRGVSLLLDTEDIISDGAYDLEISTPGVDRHLSQKWHFDSAIGKNVQLACNQALTPPEDYIVKTAVKSLVGELVAVEENSITIKSGEFNWDVPFESIHKAKIKTIFQHPGVKQAPKKNNKKR